MSGVRLLLKNSSALALVQIANLLFALALLPYLTRILGPEVYGVIALGLAGMALAGVVAEYGFGYSAVRDIAEAKSREEIEVISSAVILIKLMITCVVLLCAAAIISWQTKFEDYRSYFYILLLALVGMALTPTWFFHGTQKMTKYAFFAIPAKACYVIIVLMKVRSPEDYIWAGWGFAIAQALAALLGWILILSDGYRLRPVNLTFLRRKFAESSGYFFSRAAVSIYSSGGVVILGALGSPVQAGYYSACEKIYQALRAIVTPVAQSLFPQMVATKNGRLFVFVLGSSLICAITCLVAINAFGVSLISIIFGTEFLPARGALLGFAATFVVAVPSLFIGYPLLGAYGHVRVVNRSTLFAALIFALCLVLLASFERLHAEGVAWSLFLTESFILILRLIACARYGLFRILKLDVKGSE